MCRNVVSTGNVTGSDITPEVTRKSGLAFGIGTKSNNACAA